MPIRVLYKQIFLTELFHPSAPLVKQDFDLFSQKSRLLNKFCHLWLILFNFWAVMDKILMVHPEEHFSL